MEKVTLRMLLSRLFRIFAHENIFIIMEQNINKYIAVAYQLYTIENGNRELVEEAPEEQPFQFISGFGFALEDFEKQMVGLEQGGKFDFTLTKEQAYGDFFPDRVVDVEREIFTINGHFDHENVFTGAILPLQNEEGQRFYGKVLEIADDHVKIDLNHPLAGKELNFVGHVVESREATNEEIQRLLNHMSGEGCGCGCHDCGEECDHDHHDHEGGCGCGHCH